ncbi:centrosomal protein [Nephila pilipes]|uniref:Centrosomal protein n=1 Tax=Nephila pilipes TaxID=299642 RepID=A0A8X6QWC4_NEPPI|nr:centrosomal protein [Nephila pilipes]
MELAFHCQVIAHYCSMESQDKGFLDDTSLSKTPNSPLKTSTVLKSNASRPENLFKKRIVSFEMNSSFIPRKDQSFQILSEVTNIPNSIFPKPRFNATIESSIAEDANSSLGILHMDNFSDIADTSSFIKGRDITKALESKPSALEEEVLRSIGFKENNSVSSNSTKDLEENDRNSSSDIEYDGTNIPELNLDYDALSAFQLSKISAAENAFTVPTISVEEKKSVSDINKDQSISSTYIAENSKQSFDSVPNNEESRITRDSIFETFSPSYDSIFKGLMPNEHYSKDDKAINLSKVMKACSFLDPNSSELKAILDNQSLAEENFIKSLEKLNENSSLKFCADEISARSTSFKSPSPGSSEASAFSSEINKLDTNRLANEDIKDVVLRGSMFSQNNTKSCNSLMSKENEIHQSFNLGSLECSKDESISFIPEKNGTSQNVAIDEAFECELNYKDISKFVTSVDQNQFEILDSEFVNKDEAIEMFKKDEEILKEECKFEIVNNSKESITNGFSPPTQNDITAPSWFLELHNSFLRNSGRHISIGTLFSARTENLGRLSQDSNRERPFFGTTVSTPIRKNPEDSSVFSDTVGSISEITEEQPFSDQYSQENLIPASKSLESNVENTIHRSEQSALTDVPGKKYHNKNETEILRGSVLSQLLSETSTTQPLILADRILEACIPVNKAHSIKSNKNIHKDLDNVTNACAKYLSSMYGDTNETVNTFTISSEVSMEKELEAQISLHSKDKNDFPPNMNIFSVETNNIKMDNKDEKMCGCSNCLIHQQNIPFPSTRPPSPCSNSCSTEVPFQNPLHAQYGCLKYFNPQEQCHRNLCFSHNSVQQYANCLHKGPCHNPSIQGNLPSSILSVAIPHSAQGPLTGCNSSYALPFSMQGAVSHSFPVIQGPNELYFPEKISVGDSQYMTLTVQNIHTLQYFYHISHISAFINDESISLEMAGIHFPCMFPRSSGNTTDIQVTLSPRYEGKITVMLQIAACLNPNELTTVTIGNSSLKTKIQYESLRPSISISSNGRENLDIGSVIAGSTVTEYIKIINKCDATVPLCISLSNDSKDNRILFGLNQMKNQNFPSATSWKVLSPKTMLYRLPSSKSKTSVCHLEIPIIFEAGDDNSDVNFTLTASVQTSIFSEPLGFLRISATVGKAELALTDITQNRLLLCTEAGTVTSQNVAVKNVCSFSVVYDLMIVDDEIDAFSVWPTTLNLKSMKSSSISISFSPSSALIVKGYLQAVAQPHGKVFSIAELIGNGKQATESDSLSSKNFKTNALSKKASKQLKSASHTSSNIIECNKKYLSWGGVDVGNTVVKSFCIRNSSNKSLQAKLFIKEKSQSSFKLLNDKNEQTTTYILGLTSKEQKSISVAFFPSRIAPSSGFLAIKPVVENDQKIFSMPLAGYGGTGKLKVAEVYEKEGVGHCLDVVVSRDRRTVFSNLKIHNIGFRPVFVKVINSTDGFEKNSNEQVVINPTEFILLEKEYKTLILSCTIENFSALNVADSGIITLLYGDEIIRQQLKRSLGENSKYCHTSSYHGINFDVPFAGEERVPYDSTYVSKINISSLFASTMKKYLIHLNLVEQDANYSQMTFDALSVLDNTYSSNLANSTMFRRATTGPRFDYSPPVKDFTVDTLNRLSMPSSPSFHFDSSLCTSKTNGNITEKVDISGYWTIKPEKLTVEATNKDNRILLINLSKQDLKFKIECAVDVISVSPVSGIVSAKGQIGLRISVIPYSYGKLCEDYKGFIKVLCGGSEKSVNIKVIKDSKRMKDSLNASGNMSHDSHSIPLDVSGADKTIICSSSSIFIKNICEFPKEIVLNATAPGKVSETTLTVQNLEKFSTEWDIHPFSMLFTEFLEDSLNVTNILQILPSSGSLQVMEKTNILIKFMPSSPDRFSRFFELSLSFSNGQKQNCNFKISGSSFCLTESAEIEKTAVAQYSKKKSRTDIYVENEICEFPSTTIGQNSTLFVTVKNPSLQDVKLNITKPHLPFIVHQSSVLVRSKKFLKIPVTFKPTKRVKLCEDVLVLKSDDGNEFIIKLKGFCN